MSSTCRRRDRVDVVYLISEMVFVPMNEIHRPTSYPVKAAYYYSRMKPPAKNEIQKTTGPGQSLTNVLSESKKVKVLVEESADQLSSVNAELKQEISEQVSPPVVENILEKSESVEEKVHEASEKLAAVNRALANEVRARVMLEHQLAAATEQQLAARHAAFHDNLTGLPNRALFDNRLEYGLAQAKRHGWNLAVLFLDLDDFKIINDSYGHEVGDSVLKTIAQRLRENSRSDDTISRHGGDEFLCLLMESRREQDVAVIAEKIIAAIQAPCHVNTADLSISLGVKTSIGIAMFPKDGVTAAALINSADVAMYQAKQSHSGFAFAQ